MNSGDLLVKYEALRGCSRLMREAAGRSDWDRLIELERDRVAIAAPLQAQEEKCTWLEADRSKKNELIRDILKFDEETRSLVEPRRQELRTMFGSLYTEKRLHIAYDMV